MGRTLSGVLLKAVGALVLAMIVLGVVGTIVGIVLGIVATVASLLVSVVIFAVFLLAVVGVISLLSDTGNGDSSADFDVDDWPNEERRGRVEPSGARGSDRSRRTWLARLPLVGNGDGSASAVDDPAERLRDRYVAGELTDAEFERRMELLLETESIDRELGDRSSGVGRSFERESSRSVGAGRRSPDRERLWDR
ncbi:SHOCT domain-containing protein [Natrialbaceae archaeon GCM10025810]|uniref:SHOCT domain-containing protein n=1 Tax=Halovalidus salilacus TaxID=3075124 RepID=UPI0036175C6E